MTRKEIEPYVGTRVSAWTAMNGSYSGLLLRITDARPWRGIVRIDGVLEMWCLFEGGRRHQRTGLTLGEEYEFGACNIRVAAPMGLSKAAALREEIKKCEQWLKRPDSRHAPHNVPVRIKEEAERQLSYMACMTGDPQ